MCPTGLATAYGRYEHFNKTGSRCDEEVMQQLDPDFTYNANRYK
jgi:hypothetical protein